MKFQVNNIKLHVVDEGNQSPVLLFLHFWGGSSRTWTEVAQLLADRYRTVRYDHRGWGESDKPESGYDIKTLASDAIELIKQLQLDNYILVGHSMGGKVAQYIAAQKPDGLQKLILVAPSPASPTIFPQEAREQMLRAYTTEEGINITIDQVFQAGNIDAQIRERTIEDITKHSTASREGWPNFAMLEDVSKGLDNIKVPTLIIAGENDVIDSPKRLEQEVKDKIPGSSLVIIPKAGHLLMLQSPELVASHIDTFVKQSSADK
ncbi:alpha/beta fold hydrolase [Flavobacterium piscisymbiosum]|uniref:Alpha/beta hydrolase n=1 Tax=Flavobacterium piscisymbiosum TaxID=2893753 RepID=A0ABS8MED0_9FLAO|nr:alpha/beta hydrolase [Flavobacterium sp. F-30]MCC9063723.1 alpha/beta hydrolase [Flavobacterium sp. F-30]